MRNTHFRGVDNQVILKETGRRRAGSVCIVKSVVPEIEVQIFGLHAPRRIELPFGTAACGPAAQARCRKGVFSCKFPSAICAVDRSSLTAALYFGNSLVKNDSRRTQRMRARPDRLSATAHYCQFVDKVKQKQRLNKFNQSASTCLASCVTATGIRKATGACSAVIELRS